MPTTTPRSRSLLPAALVAAAWAFTPIATTPAHAQATAEKPDAEAKAKAKAIAKEKAERAQPPKTYANVPYGEHPRQVLDFWKAESDVPTPVLVFIHGGGWVNGDKSPVSPMIDLRALLKAGISVASINYRFTTQADEAGVKPPVQWPLGDAMRAVQFLRSKSAEWNIDKKRFAASGGSAGACSSLWLAFHDDMAKPDSPDPVARESTRLTCAAVSGAQTSLDPHQTRAWMPNMAYGGHAFGFNGGGQARDRRYQEYYDHRDEILPWIKEYSPYEHAGPGDPPVFLDYPNQAGIPREGEKQKDPTHSAVQGLKLGEKLKEGGVEYHLTYPGEKDPEYANITAFLIAKLKGRAD